MSLPRRTNMSLEQHKLQRNASVYAVREYVWGGKWKKCCRIKETTAKQKKNRVCIHRIKTPFASQTLSATDLDYWQQPVSLPGTGVDSLDWKMWTKWTWESLGRLGRISLHICVPANIALLADGMDVRGEGRVLVVYSWVYCEPGSCSLGTCFYFCAQFLKTR